MKILKFILPLAVIALLCSFVVSRYSSVEAITTHANKKVVSKKKPVDPLYKKFIDKFESPSFPYSIKFEKPAIEKDYEDNPRQVIDKSKYLGANFSKMIPEIEDGMMSRMGPDDFVAEALIKKSDKFDLVIYSRVPSFRAAKTYYAATYDKKGDKISDLMIATKNYDFIKECKVTSEGKIVIEKFVVSSKYDKSTNKTKFSYSKSGVDTYSINDSGKLIEESKWQNTAHKDLGMN